MRATLEQVATACGFVAVTCCDQVAGYVNPRPLSPEAVARFEQIRQRHVSRADPFGNGWTSDPEARALLADPASQAPPPDGDRLGFTCRSCGTAFVWADGAVRRVPKEVA